MSRSAPPRPRLRPLLAALLRPFEELLQLAVPPRRRVCYLSRPDYSDSTYYMYRHLLRSRSGLEHVWLLLDPRAASRIEREFRALADPAAGHTLRIAARRSVRGYWLYLRSRWVFHTHGVYSLTRRAFRRCVVNLWHGMPIKCIGRLNRVTPNPYPTFGTLHVATSHFFRYVIAAAFGVPPETVAVTGLPRCDALRGAAARGTAAGEVRRRLGIPDGRRLVLWMPTYRTEREETGVIRSFLDDLPGWLPQALSDAAQAHGCAVVVKLHPKDLLARAARPGAGLPGLTLLTAPAWEAHEIQLYDLIAASDALLSDVSSVLIDYLVTGRPIGIVGFDPHTYTRELTFPMDVILGSRRYAHLDDAAAVSRFFAGLGDPAAAEPGDVAALLHEPQAGPSAEAVARAAQL